jgi:hypothetical protein
LEKKANTRGEGCGARKFVWLLIRVKKSGGVSAAARIRKSESIYIYRGTWPSFV